MSNSGKGRGKGWFKVPGIRPEGDRSLEEQMMGLGPALEECSGKTVLDLGCAEGLISLEFAKAGAALVVGIEVVPTHLDVARQVCKDYPQIKLIQAHLAEYIPAQKVIEQFDIVLALGIIQKLYDPQICLDFAAKSARNLMLFRAPAKVYNGIITSKRTDKWCNVPKTMMAHGFVDEKLIHGVRGEAVQYWRKK